jgi:predicted nuclease of predicted toxin-antitoxin system
MPLKLYLDENVDVSVASALRQRGVDVVTARDREKLGASDEEHLVQARAEGRVLVTHDIADFIRLHQRWVAAGTLHAGIALSNIIPPGALLRRLFRLCESMSEAEGHLIFLGADYR